MISLGAAIVRAALRAYTYPYRKRFASLSRSIAPKNKPYVPPEGFAFAVEEYGGVRVEKVVPPECGNGAVLQFHGGGSGRVARRKLRLHRLQHRLSYRSPSYLSRPA